MDTRRVKRHLAERARRAHQLAIDDAISENVHSLLVLLKERRMAEVPNPNRCRTLRLERGLTAQFVADANGMSLKQYLRIEKGGNTTLARMRQLAGYFELPVTSVFHLDEAVPA